MKLIKIFIFCLIALTAFGQEFTPDNFTYSFTVETTGAEVNSFSLPAHVYQNLYNDRRDDIKVFNATGESVPFVLVRPEPERFEMPPVMDLKTFPVFKEVAKPAGSGEETVQVMSEIIIDIRELDYMPHELVFFFKEGVNFNDTMRIYTSSGDLDSWSGHGSGNLAQLISSENEIVSNTIDLAYLPQSTQYLSLRVDDPAVLPAITGIRATFEPIPVYSTPQELNIRGLKDLDGDILFDMGGAYPVEWVDFGIESSYFFLGFKMFGSDDLNDWVHLFTRDELSKYPYDRTIDGTSMKTSRRYSHYAVYAVDSLPDSADATFYWHPDILIFLSKGGNNTYTIAYGSEYYISDSAVTAASSRLQLNASSPIIAIGEPELIGDGMPPYELPKAESETSGILKYIMIAIIALAIILLSFAAIKLLRDVNRK